jgi:hypothetical protein
MTDMLFQSALEPKLEENKEARIWARFTNWVEFGEIVWIRFWESVDFRRIWPILPINRLEKRGIRFFIPPWIFEPCIRVSDYLSGLFYQTQQLLTLRATEELVTPLLSLHPRGHPSPPSSSTLSYWIPQTCTYLGREKKGGLELGEGRKKQYGVVAAAELARHWLQQHLGTSKGAISGSGVARASSASPPACQWRPEGQFPLPY